MAAMVLHKNAANVANIASAKDTINKMINKFSVELGDFVVSKVQSAACAVVFLMGLTGGQGSYLLESLLIKADEWKVLCLQSILEDLCINF
jgi:hypothetical protein